MDKKLQPYADIAVVVGKYTKDGKERNRYQKIGVLLATPHMSHMVIKLDTLPLGGDGWLAVFPRGDKEGGQEAGHQERDIEL